MGFSNLNVAANGSSSTLATAAASATTSARANNAEDRFLRLLITQMQNQDPLNPMDNAQVTSQMAQIQTVTGIEKLNTSVVGLNTQFAQLQALSGASLVGRGVLVEGNRLAVEDGQGRGGFDLPSQADRVRVEVLNSGGRVIDTVDLGAMPSGRHSFDWAPRTGIDATQGVQFRVTATLGATAVNAAPLTHDRVVAVSSGPEGLMLELAEGGLIGYEQIKVFQ